MMNIKDMQLFMEAIKSVDDELRFRAMEFNGGGSRGKELKAVQISALKNHRERIVYEFELRHDVIIER